MAIKVEPAFHTVPFWIPVEYREQTTQWHHRFIQWIDSYFHLTGPVAVPVDGAMLGRSTEVYFEEKIQPLWLTILKVISYATVIIPAILLTAKWALRSLYSFHITPSTPLNEPEEIAAVVNNVLQLEVHAEKEQAIFVNPQFLISEDKIESIESEGGEVNFAEVMVDGEPQLVPVKRSVNGEYARCIAPAEQILLHMVSNEWLSDAIKSILDYPHQGDLPKKFFSLLLVPDKEGKLPIDRAIKNGEHLLLILQYAKKHHVDIDPAIIDDLFVKWAGRGYTQLTQTLLAFHPDAIRKTKENASLFSLSVLNGAIHEIPVLIQAMRDQNIDFTPLDAWLYKAYMNDCRFTKEEFLALPQEQQRKIFQVANLYMHREFLLKLREFMVKGEFLPLNKTAWFSANMDALDVMQATHDFLKSMCNDGYLVTDQEFQALRHLYSDPNHMRATVNGSFHVQWKFQEEAKRLHLDFIKPLRIAAVIRPQVQNKGYIDMLINGWDRFDLESPDIAIYPEKITPIERRLTRIEMTGLITVLEKVDYQFIFSKTNLLMGRNSDGDEGLYFTSQLSLFNDDPDYRRMHLLTELMAPEDHDWLKEEIRLRRENYELWKNPQRAAIEHEKELEKEQAITHGFGITRNMRVPIAEVLG